MQGLTLGAGAQWVSQDDLFEQFAPFGFTKRSFALLLEALGVPRMHMPNGMKIVDIEVFRLGMKFVTALGRPDFLSPGYKGKRPMGSVTQISEQEFASRWRRTLKEYLGAREMGFRDNPAELRYSTERAMQRLAMQVSMLQQEFYAAEYEDDEAEEACASG